MLPVSAFQPTVAATLWLDTFIFILELRWTLCVPVAHFSCYALKGLDDILTLELLFCSGTYCTFLGSPADQPFCVIIRQKDNVKLS